MPSLSDYIVPLTKDQIVAGQLNLLALAGFPATSWQAGSVPLTLVQADAATLADVTATIANVAQGGYLNTAAGPWLDLLGVSSYGLTRNAAIVTQGNLLLTDRGGGGPYTITAGQLYAASPDGKYRYTNVTGGTLAQSGTLSLLWQGESAGSSYNLPIGGITSLVTPLPGVVVSNPDNGTGLGTWITQQGVNAESDDSYKIRCSARWPSLGGGATALAYKGWALTAAPTVTRVNVLESTPVSGSVTIYCAGPNGASSSADVAAVNAYIQVRRPLCVTVIVNASVNLPIAITGTVFVSTTSLLTAKAAFSAVLTTYQTSLPVGGAVYLARIVELLMDTFGVVNVTGLLLNGFSIDIQLATQQTAVFDVSGITWAGV